MSVQHAQEYFRAKADLNVIKEENTLALVPLEPNRCEACQRVYVCVAERLVDEGRFPGFRRSAEEEDCDVSPWWRFFEFECPLDSSAES